MAKKSNEQMLEELRQKMNRDRLRERELTNRINTAKRKRRNHVLIMIGSAFLKQYDADVEQFLLDSSDDDVKSWIDDEMDKIRRNADGYIQDWLDDVVNNQDHEQF